MVLLYNLPLYFDLSQCVLIVRCGVFHLLGVLCQQFPEHMIDNADRLVKIYTSNLKAEVRHRYVHVFVF